MPFWRGRTLSSRWWSWWRSWSWPEGGPRTQGTSPTAEGCTGQTPPYKQLAPLGEKKNILSSESIPTYESDNKDSKKDPQGVAEDVRQHNRGEGHLKFFGGICCLHSLKMRSSGTSLAWEQKVTAKLISPRRWRLSLPLNMVRVLLECTPHNCHFSPQIYVLFGLNFSPQ